MSSMFLGFVEGGPGPRVLGEVRLVPIQMLKFLRYPTVKDRALRAPGDRQLERELLIDTAEAVTISVSMNSQTGTIYLVDPSGKRYTAGVPEGVVISSTPVSRQC